jgi:hypothetical protein
MKGGNMKTKIDILPTPRSPEFMGGRVYFHVMLAPNVIERLKQTAYARGYKPGMFLEELLDNVLPKKVRHKVIKRIPATVKMIRTKEVA